MYSLTFEKLKVKPSRSKRAFMSNIAIFATLTVLVINIVVPTGLFGSYTKATLFDARLLQKTLENPESLKAPTSRYDDLIQKYAKKAGIDWRLVLSIVHTESNFENKAESKMGARGLMQIMPSVAKTHGVTSAFRPEENISAGVKHFANMLKKVVGNSADDRLKLAIAAYNVGIGHIWDAQKLAKQMGKNAKRWKNVQAALILLQNSQYAVLAKYGYCKGLETVDYVTKVTGRYKDYQHKYPESSIILTKGTKRFLSSNV
jgi:membrane-bound lytic murein transglycosylase F